MGSSPRRSRLRKGLFALACVAALPLVLELLLQIYVRVRGVELPFEYYVPDLYEPDPELGAQLKPSTETKFRGRVYRHNSLGTLGPEFSPERPRDVLRIFTCGESSSYLEDYPRELETRLNRKTRQGGKRVEVINLGVPGYTSRANLLRLKRYLQYDPHLVLYYGAVNDAMLAFGWEPGPNPAEPYQESFLRKSLLVFFVTRTLRPGQPEKGPGRFPSRPIETDPARNLARYATNVREIVRESRSKGRGALLATFVYLQMGPVKDPLVEAIQQYNEALRKIAKEEGAYLVDTASLIEGDPAVHRPHFVDPVHFDELYAERLSKRMGDFIEENIAVFRAEPAVPLEEEGNRERR